jgi:hypothetical protein
VVRPKRWSRRILPGGRSKSSGRVIDVRVKRVHGKVVAVKICSPMPAYGAPWPHFTALPKLHSEVFVDAEVV